MTKIAGYELFLGKIHLIKLQKIIIYFSELKQVITKNNLYLLMLHGIIYKIFKYFEAA